MRRSMTPILAIIVLGLFTAASLQAMAPDDKPAPKQKGQQGGRGGPQQGGVHLIPRFVAEELDLTAEQKEAITTLEKETQAKLEKILTAEQLKTLKEARPPQGGPGGQGGQGGAQGGGPDGQDGPPPQDGQGQGGRRPPRQQD